MYCTKCGIALNENANFCSDCGTATRRSTFAAPVHTRLSRPRDERKVAGVCAGFARYLGVDVTVIRLVAVILIFCPVGLGLIAYLVSWIIMPNDPLLLPAPASHAFSSTQTS